LVLPTIGQNYPPFKWFKQLKCSNSQTGNCNLQELSGSYWAIARREPKNLKCAATTARWHGLPKAKQSGVSPTL
jgi:hypothetical protein